MLNSTRFSFLPDTYGEEYGFAHYIFFLSALLGGWKVLSSVFFASTSPLKKIPGPRLASFTPWYRVWLFSSGNAPSENLKLHQTYGPIVRTGPNTVSISDVAAIPTIYGITSHFIKVVSCQYVVTASGVDLNITVSFLHDSLTNLQWD